ncbi:patatin-like phospholipase family protein [Ruixingdingia sedimenti]|uniref:Patatin-like phospholipase family protein n=1 Tax=Ruixingdingia sedimenti TaxID=3073604 RepID=A0ABU1F559_9RHOB|nr:patatin-like phospholipase family protein [Xinfangfangia sp. LG-4]MDR5652009.1 patatin-like phospholipase family protein [Xinfangfangia sp. LG-4]
MIRSLTLAALGLLAACSAVNAPINRALHDGANPPLVDPAPGPPGEDELYVGLAFSGGGMRASAFAYGMAEALREAPTGTPNGLLDNVRLVSGVSGGSVTAAQLGLHGPAGLRGYRERYLVTDAETYMANSPLNPLTIVRGLSGGANGRATFARYLDETLYHGATFGDLRARSRVKTWINATDMANRTPFLFSPETFDALCSDLSSLPLSEAVAASAAFPLVFSPIVLEAHQGECAYAEPDWLTAARHNPEATAAMRAHARALESYADPAAVKYVKLLDGGITDNFGTTGLAVERARARAAYAPMTPAEAVRLKRLLFLVANAGVEVDYGWTQKIPGPGGAQLAMSIAGASLGAATRAGYDAMRGELRRWQEDLVEWRCALPPAEVRRLRGTAAGWDCRDVKLFVGEVSFEGLDPEARKALNAIPTRLRLTPDQVDRVIAAGRAATRASAEFNGFLHSFGGDAVAERMAAQGGRRIAPARTVAVTP